MVFLQTHAFWQHVLCHVRCYRMLLRHLGNAYIAGYELPLYHSSNTWVF